MKSKVLYKKLYLISVNLNTKVMKINYIPSLLISTSILFLSCKKELDPQDSVVTNSNSQTESAPISPSETGLTTAAPVNSAVNQQITTQTTPVNTPTATTLPGMNPPHGQANHRCDIAVGAPLNSPIKKAAPATTVSTPTVSTPVTTTPAILNSNTTPTITQPGMNPPHGQAGHLCSVAVGAPLPKQ